MTYHFDNLKSDTKAFEYFNELKKIKNYAYESPTSAVDISVAWAIKKASEFFFDEMDYFDNSIKTISEKSAIFAKRMELLCMVSWSVEDKRHNIINLPCLYGDVCIKKYTELWKEMHIDINKTTIWIQDGYGIFIRCAGDHDTDSITLKHNISDFNKGYMTNIVNMARKQLENIVQRKKIEFENELNKYELKNFITELKKENQRLEYQLTKHTDQYKKMSDAFNETQKANEILHKKIVTQDKLIIDLSKKMDLIIGLFGWFKEEIPKQMLKSIVDVDFPQIEKLLHDGTETCTPTSS